MKLPKARNSNIVINELEKELLIYDLSISKAFCLNETTAIVFNACGTNRTFDDLKREYNFTSEIVYLALDELRKNDLLEENYDSPFAGMSRREAVKKVGFTSMIALPIISSLAAPAAAMAQSIAANCQTCAANADCASGRCLRNALGGGNICAVTTNSGSTYPIGTTFGAGDAQCIQVVGPSFCCSGRADKSTGVCTCN